MAFGQMKKKKVIIAKPNNVIYLEWEMITGGLEAWIDLIAYLSPSALCVKSHIKDVNEVQGQGSFIRVMWFLLHLLLLMSLKSPACWLTGHQKCIHVIAVELA